MAALTPPTATSPLVSSAAQAPDAIARQTANQDFGRALARSVSNAQHKARREQATADTHNAQARHKADKPDRPRVASPSDEVADAQSPDAALGLLDWRGLRPEAREAREPKETSEGNNAAGTGPSVTLSLDASPASSAASVSAQDTGNEIAAQGGDKNSRAKTAEDALSGAGLQASPGEKDIQNVTELSQAQALPASPAPKDLSELQVATGPQDTASAPLAPPAPLAPLVPLAAPPSAALSPSVVRTPNRAPASSRTTSPAPSLAGTANPAHALQTKNVGKAAATAASPAASPMAAALSAEDSFSPLASGSKLASKSGSGNGAGDDASVFSASLNAASSPSTPSAPSEGANSLGDSLGTTASAQASSQVWTQLEPEVGSPAWHQALSQQVMHMRAGNVNEAELQLNPAGLGPLRIKLSLRDQQLDAEFSAAHAQVRAALEAALPQLREALQQGGMHLGQAWVEPAPAQATAANMGNMSHSNDGGRQAYGQSAQDSEGGRESARVGLAARTGLSGSVQLGSSAAAGLSGAIAGGQGPGQRLNTFA